MESPSDNSLPAVGVAAPSGQNLHISELPAGDVELPDGFSSKDDVVIALMGVTGAGKSTFIKNVTQRQDIQIGHDLTSETIECKAYHFNHAGVNFTLVDTPGFNDTYLDDATILAQLAAFMESTYRAQIRMTAIIYLHPIINDRLEGSALDNLGMFRKLCGPKFYPNVVLATTFWSKVDAATGVRREQQLRDNDEFWGGMIKRGSQMERLPDDRTACVNLLLRLAGSKAKAALQIQQELVDEGLSIAQTQAGGSAKNFAALEALRNEFASRLAQLAAERKAEMARQQAEFRRLRAEQEAEFEERLRRHREDLEASKRAHEALLREAAEKRQRMITEQEALIQQTQEETARLRLELEQLSVRDRADEEARRRSRIQQDVKTRLAAVNTALSAQNEIFAAAQRAGMIRAAINVSWINDYGKQRSVCDVCAHVCSAQLSYSCNGCEDFEVCSRCWDEGRRCPNETHESYARRSLVGMGGMGKCRRATNPPWTRYRIPCDRCGRFLKDTYYYHCCICNSDNYDLCPSCIMSGWTCLNVGHVLKAFRT